MPIEFQPVYDTLDAVPEPIRGSFEMVDGKAVFSKPVQVETLPEVAGLRSTLDKIKRREKELSDRIAAFGDLDGEKLAAMQQELDTLRASKSGSKEEMDRAIAQIRDAHGKEVQKLTQQNTDLSQRIQNREKDLQISTALGKYEPVTAGAQKALQRLVRDYTTVVDEDGDLVTQVLDEKGKVRYSKKTGEPMTLLELVEEMSESDEYKALFKGTGVSGGGGHEGNSGSARRIGGKRIVTKTQMEDRAFYQSLAAEAKKQGKTVMDIVEVRDE